MPRSTVLWFPLLLVGTVPGQSAPVIQKSGPSPDFAAIDAYVTREMRGERIPGVSIAIVHGGEVVHARGFGADGAGHAITPQTPFLIGSMSKSFTALALMQLVQAGKVNLDSPAQFYLPEFRVADSVASASITLRHLLYHTSGIPTKAPRATTEGGGLLAQVAALSRDHLGERTRHPTRVRQSQLHRARRDCRRIAGMSFADYVRSQLFTPLDMQHSYVSQDDAMQAGMSRGHRYWFGFPVANVMSHGADSPPRRSWPVPRTLATS